MAIVYTNQSSGYSRKNKKKMNSLSANQLAEFKEDLRIHNKHYKSKGLHSMLMTLDDYIKYRFGALPKTKSRICKAEALKFDPFLSTKRGGSRFAAHTPELLLASDLDNSTIV